MDDVDVGSKMFRPTSPNIDPEAWPPVVVGKTGTDFPVTPSRTNNIADYAMVTGRSPVNPTHPQFRRSGGMLYEGSRSGDEVPNACFMDKVVAGRVSGDRGIFQGWGEGISAKALLQGQGGGNDVGVEDGVVARTAMMFQGNREGVPGSTMFQGVFGGVEETPRRVMVETGGEVGGVARTAMAFQGSRGAFQGSGVGISAQGAQGDSKFQMGGVRVGDGLRTVGNVLQAQRKTFRVEGRGGFVHVQQTNQRNTFQAGWEGAWRRNRCCQRHH